MTPSQKPVQSPSHRPVQLREASTYPKFCPVCGNRRQEQGTTMVGPTYVCGIGEMVAHEELIWSPIKFCVRCGLDWSCIPDPATAFTRRLVEFSDHELMTVLRMVYVGSKNLISTVAVQREISISGVQKILAGERKNANVDAAIVKEFRRRLQDSENMLAVQTTEREKTTNAS